MSYCPNCGVQIDDGISFCPNCGAKAGTVEKTASKGTAKKPGSDTSWLELIIIIVVVFIVLSFIVWLFASGVNLFIDYVRSK